MARRRKNAYRSPGPVGNTSGMILPKTAVSSGANPNPAVEPETEEEKGWWSSWGSDLVHTALDVAGMVPIVGNIADAANVVVYAAEGDAVNAAISAAAMVPGAGQAATAGRLATKAAKTAGKAAAKKAAERAAKEAAEKAAKEAAERAAKKKAGKTGGGKKSNGGYVKPKGRAPKAKPKCFGGKQTKKNPAEYDRQLQLQEDALNNMSVDEYLKNRDRWSQMKRAGTATEQAKARAKAVSNMAKTNKDALLAQGVPAKEAAVRGRQQAETAAKGMDILHSPDLNAGGSASGTTGLGDKGVNRSIGSNWGNKKGNRVNTLDRAARSVPESARKDTKMNVKLKRCK